MKQTLLILIATVFSTISSAQWNQISIGNYHRLDKIYFINNNIGYAVGYESNNSSSDRHLILKTEDGGISWDTTFLSSGGSTFKKIDIHFPSSDTGYVGGYFNKNYVTVNGGNSWSAITSNLNPTSFTNIHFITTNTGFGCRNSSCYKTTDGAQTWVIDSNVTGATQIQFINDTIGFAMQGSSVLITEDQGNNWLTSTIDTLYFNSLSFRSREYGFAAGEGIARTTDGGINWTISHFPDVQGFMCIQMVTDSVGYAGGVGPTSYIYKTSDGGDNWYKQEVSPASNQLMWLHCPSVDTCYAIDYWGNIFKTTNGGGPLLNVSINENSEKEEINIYPNPTNGLFTIEINQNSNKNIEVKIYNLLGELVYSETAKNQTGITKRQIDISTFGKGMYLVQVQAGDNRVSKKVVYR